MFQAQLLSGPPPVRNGWIDELTAVILQRSRVLTAFAANRERTGFVDGARDVKVAGGVPEQDEFVIRDRSISRPAGTIRLQWSSFSPPRGRQTFPSGLRRHANRRRDDDAETCGYRRRQPKDGHHLSHHGMSLR